MVICKRSSHRLVIGPSSEVNTCFSKLVVSSLVLSIASRHPLQHLLINGLHFWLSLVLKISTAAALARVLTVSTLSDFPHVPLENVKVSGHLTTQKAGKTQRSQTQEDVVNSNVVWIMIKIRNYVQGTITQLMIFVRNILGQGNLELPH